MGYYTIFSLNRPHQWSQNMKQFLVDLQTGYFDTVDDVDDFICGESGYDWKWYDHEDHFLKLSLEFPNNIFELEGEGEGRDDIWKKYFRNGKMFTSYGKTVFEEFDESKLK